MVELTPKSVRLRTMTIVDLDFEEELKETNFPDLLDGVPAARPRRKKKGQQKRLEKPSPDRQYIRSTLQIKDAFLSSELQTVSADDRPTRVDPPSSVGDCKRSDKVLTPASSLDDEVQNSQLNENSNEKMTETTRRCVISDDHMQTDVSPATVPTVGKKLPATKLSKRDFIERSRCDDSHHDDRTLPVPVKSLRPTGKVLPTRMEMVKLANDTTVELKNTAAVRTQPAQKTRHYLDQMRFDTSSPQSTTHKMEKLSSHMSNPSTATTLDNSPIENDTLPIENQTYPEVMIQRDTSNQSMVSSLQDDECELNDSEVEENASIGNSMDSAKLLERARDRIARQELTDEVSTLKATIERKNEELENLHGQLRRAVATKCDLVIAHNELEKAHTTAMNKKENNLLRMKQANIWLLEAQSVKEKELINEIVRLTDLCNDLEEKHREELDDWERMHRNEMLEKDFEIAKLSEELRKARALLVTPPTTPIMTRSKSMASKFSAALNVF